MNGLIDEEYAKFRMEIIRRVLDGAGAADVAELLEVEKERFPEMALELDREIETYGGAR